MKTFTAAMLIFLLMTANASFAHSGGTDANGCHAGSQPYHCHGGSTGGSGGGSTGQSEEDKAKEDAIVEAIIIGSVSLFAVGILALVIAACLPEDYSQNIEDTENGLAAFGVPTVDVLVGEDSGGLQLKWFW